MSSMFVTELVFQPEMSASNADAPPNMASMFVTELVSQPEMSASNAHVPRNMCFMFVTELVSQPEMSALNADAPKNISLMSVTSLTSHDGISAHSAGGLLTRQLSTAVLRSLQLVNDAASDPRTNTPMTRNSRAIITVIDTVPRLRG